MVRSTRDGRTLPARFRFQIDAPVLGSDGPVGTLRHLIVDAGTQTVLGLVVRRGSLFAREVRLPLEAVVVATEEQVDVWPDVSMMRELRVTQAELPGCKVLRGPGAGEAGPAGGAANETVRLGAATVRAVDGRAGLVRQAVVDAASGEIVELVIESGLFLRTSRRLPGTRVRRITRAGIELDMTVSAVAGLAPYRGDRELRSEILDAWFYDDRLRSMLLHGALNVHVREGVATLEGYVRSRQARLRMEERAASVPGVVEVRVEVVTDEEMAHAAAAALLSDPRTRCLQPSIQSTLGTISLEGEAPDAIVRDAAAEAVAALPRVRGVVNRLRVRTSGGPPLRVRLLPRRLSPLERRAA